MKALIQRVLQASVQIDNQVVSSIPKGLLVYLCCCVDDDLDDMNWILNKISNARIFSDSDGKMNLSLGNLIESEDEHEILVVSQFTLSSDMRKGNRPSFNFSMNPDDSIKLYEASLNRLRSILGEERVKSGRFGADMKVASINDGPVTFFIDSRK